MPEEDPQDEPTRRRTLVLLLVILACVAGGVFLWHQLAQTSALQDCVMAGRRNCAPIPQKAP
ncbi:MAG TPA: hypothetical protein VMU82_19605 [Acetobacteraceae bacterium]|nr:hypothetical protein [Acetobacteraceae bacterium]